MCSVVGCDWLRRGGRQRFKLPEDPERRLEWVQFLATVNKQCFKESSWTDITICSRHFKDDCFENLTPTHSGSGLGVTVRLKPGAAPTLCPQQPDHHTTCVESEGTAKAASEHDQLEACNRATSSSEVSGFTLVSDQGSSVVPRGVTCTAAASECAQLKHRNLNYALIRQEEALLRVKGKHFVNEKLPLFSSKCPSCGGKLKMERVISGFIIILNQQCHQCEYRNQWESKVNATDPTAEDQHLTGGTEVTPEALRGLTDDNQSGITGLKNDAAIDEERDRVAETETSDEGDTVSDEEWNKEERLSAEELQDESNEETEYEDVDYPCFGSRHSQLCTDCGKFFSKLRPHTCEHKIKPYSCNICGKRCVNENALQRHCRIHDDNYEYRCKFCHAAFKTKGGKVTHEQIHRTQGKPYKCPDCSETFATNKDRSVHLEVHQGPKQLKCNICGIEFPWPLKLQRHLVVHTGLKPFKCSVCQRGFNQPGHLKSHMRLHTGERPYKCQHCDKCFNHNVSLKSHVQRYHTARCEGMSKGASTAGDAQENVEERSSKPHDAEEEDDTEDDAQWEGTDVPKQRWRSTGRPIGRPKSSAPSSVAPAVPGEGRRPSVKTSKAKRLKRTRCSAEDSEDEQSDSESRFDSAEEGEPRRETARKSAGRSRGRLKDSGSDSEREPEDGKKQTCGRQNIKKASVRQKGRPRKNRVI